MELLNRISRLVRANVNSLVNGAEDPEKALQQAMIEMQQDLVSLRQAVAQAIATQKRTERQSQQALSIAEEWHARAQMALQKGEEASAREALIRSQTHRQTAQTLSAQITQQTAIVQTLKTNLFTLERKIADARTQRDMYIARARAAQSSARLNEMLTKVGNVGATNAFERMESRVLDLEAQAEIADTFAVDPLDQQFSQMEKQLQIDGQLAQMKTQIKAQIKGR
ncbi:MAG: phage shock protein A [Phormidesmis priestleyi]|uniref:Phage shock protein A n=1 Tax=Phormidesmis priestleyi TaxID=268141 RepID=A0A2W4ZZB9_9CYAN|nr:MAG: phage shock protein A [Phormidesmis priestleyi]